MYTEYKSMSGRVAFMAQRLRPTGGVTAAISIGITMITPNQIGSQPTLMTIGSTSEPERCTTIAESEAGHFRFP